MYAGGELWVCEGGVRNGTMGGGGYEGLFEVERRSVDGGEMRGS